MPNLQQDNVIPSGSAIQQASKQYSKVMSNMKSNMKKTTPEQSILWHRSSYSTNKVKVSCFIKSNVCLYSISNKLYRLKKCFTVQ